MMNALTQAELKEKLHYEPETGAFTWKTKRRGIKVCGVAGTYSHKYIAIMVNYRRYLAHRLAWLYMTGTFPDNHVDHINGDRADNRWRNLRQATRSENICNSKLRSNNRLGFKGVSKESKGAKYRIRIEKNGKCHNLHGFETAEIAHEFAMLMRETLHGEYARHI